MCYGDSDTINWSYRIPDDGRVVHFLIPISRDVVLKDKIVVLGQVLVNISGCRACRDC